MMSAQAEPDCMFLEDHMRVIAASRVATFVTLLSVFVMGGMLVPASTVDGAVNDVAGSSSCWTRIWSMASGWYTTPPRSLDVKIIY